MPITQCDGGQWCRCPKTTPCLPPAPIAVSDDFDAHIVAREAELNAPTCKHIAYRRHDQIDTCVCDYGRDHIADLDDFDAACGTSVACEYDCPGRPANRNRYARPQRGASC